MRRRDHERTVGRLERENARLVQLNRELTEHNMYLTGRPRPARDVPEGQEAFEPDLQLVEPGEEEWP